MTFHPAFRQRTTPTIDISGPEPHKVTGTGKKAVHILIRKAHTPVYTVPHRILPGHSQRHIHSVQSHIIDLFLPTLPIPPRSRITKRTVVKIMPVNIRGYFSHLLFHLRKRIRQLHMRSIPTILAMSIFVEVMVQCTGYRNTIISPQHNLFPFLF